jgi:primosomal protein N' (replication factor Y)
VAAPTLSGSRLVEVAVDAVGTGGTATYTYRVPDELTGLEPGEAVIVGYGRRQALGIVLGTAAAPAGVTVKPIEARVRTDGPLLPALTLSLARAVAHHYLAPIALVIRAGLPPGLLERLELVAVAVAPGAPAAGDPAGEAALVAAIAAPGPGGIAVRDLPFDGGRAALLRRLRAIEGSGAITLEWRLGQPGATPRLERRVAVTRAGRTVAAMLAAGSRPPGARLGSRQRALLAELAGAVPPAGGEWVEATLPGDAAEVRPGDTATADAGATAHAAGAAAANPAGGIPAALLASRHGPGALSGLAARGLIEIWTAERPRRPLEGRLPGMHGTRPPGSELEPRQATALGAVSTAIRKRDARTFLLDGVTGGGKTAVYAGAIAAALDTGRDALVLVPEIAHAVPLVDRLRADLGTDVALLHGGLSEGERADEWRRIRSGAVRVVVGTRSAVLAPVANPGVVIVDEEHDASYKSDRTPRIQARDVAEMLGRLAAAPVVLGSATPDVATMGRARSGVVARYALEERPSGRPPTVAVVDLRDELAAGNRGLLSRALSAAIAELDTTAGDRAILVINRRGSASVVLCRDCGYVQVCPECRRPLVYHAAASALRCHHCGATAPIAHRCPACGSARIRYLGGGTERLEREVRERFPDLRVARLDRDVAARRGATVRILDAFRDGQLDVLVGTSLVSKGIDVPEVTLVGVVSADIAMNLPDIRAAERTYQLLVQAIGRAGRGVRPGRAYVQTYRPDHPAVRAAVSGDAAAFYDAELADRRTFRAPPFGRLIKLTVALPDRADAEAEARRLAAELRERAAMQPVAPGASGALAPAGFAAPGAVPPWAPEGAEEQFAAEEPVAPGAPDTQGVQGTSGTPGAAGTPVAVPGRRASPSVDVLGPVPAYVARRGGRWRFHVVLRGSDPLGVLRGDPGPPWSVDVDPESLL